MEEMNNSYGYVPPEGSNQQQSEDGENASQPEQQLKSVWADGFEQSDTQPEQQGYANNGMPQINGQREDFQPGNSPQYTYGYQQQSNYQQLPTSTMPGPYAVPFNNTNLSFSGLAVAGFVVAIVALVFSWLFSFLNVFVFVGLGLSIAGIVATGIGKGKRGRGLAVAGTIISVVALVASIAFGSMYISAFSEGFESAFTSHSRSSYTEHDAMGNTVSSDAKVNGFESGQHGVVNISDGYTGTTENGDDVFVVVYTLKNTGDSNIAFTDLVMDIAEQDGEELDINYDSDLQSIVRGDTSTFVDDADDIAPGQEVNVIRGYDLNDDQKSVTISASGWKSAGSETISKNFQIS
ncbi:DUF5067 domain-containing protein [Bifidobacterium sp.]|jgi:hypothetical protein|uniref:DUF5067 domain-containing protein n=1 Tax=Bifidobacterium sp. TaxID=41200 RepID=UPI0025C2135B|nr:DUF5067 domain-containing protein [Bifidobacterium sp.]MCI1634973.1 DUF5067 domain-containing protein [Bifidobacterium sp.]